MAGAIIDCSGAGYDEETMNLDDIEDTGILKYAEFIKGKLKQFIARKPDKLLHQGPDGDFTCDNLFINKDLELRKKRKKAKEGTPTKEINSKKNDLKFLKRFNHVYKKYMNYVKDDAVMHNLRNQLLLERKIKDVANKSSSKEKDRKIEISGNQIGAFKVKIIEDNPKTEEKEKIAALSEFDHILSKKNEKKTLKSQFTCHQMSYNDSKKQSLNDNMDFSLPASTATKLRKEDDMCSMKISAPPLIESNNNTLQPQNIKGQINSYRVINTQETVNDQNIFEVLSQNIDSHKDDYEKNKSLTKLEAKEIRRVKSKCRIDSVPALPSLNELGTMMSNNNLQTSQRSIQKKSKNTNRTGLKINTEGGYKISTSIPKLYPFKKKNLSLHSKAKTSIPNDSRLNNVGSIKNTALCHSRYITSPSHDKEHQNRNSQLPSASYVDLFRRKLTLNGNLVPLEDNLYYNLKLNDVKIGAQTTKNSTIKFVDSKSPTIKKETLTHRVNAASSIGQENNKNTERNPIILIQESSDLIGIFEPVIDATLQRRRSIADNPGVPPNPVFIDGKTRNEMVKKFAIQTPIGPEVDVLAEIKHSRKTANSIKYLANMNSIKKSIVENGEGDSTGRIGRIKSTDRGINEVHFPTIEGGIRQLKRKSTILKNENIELKALELKEKKDWDHDEWEKYRGFFKEVAKCKIEYKKFKKKQIKEMKSFNRKYNKLTKQNKGKNEFKSDDDYDKDLLEFIREENIKKEKIGNRARAFDIILNKNTAKATQTHMEANKLMHTKGGMLKFH